MRTSMPLCWVSCNAASFPHAPNPRSPPLCRTSLPPSAARVACRLQYNGAAFHGWESKPDFRTVESTLERAVADVLGTYVKITAASRTDARAHAIGQVVHFDVDQGRGLADARAWVGALNRRLPQDVRVMDAAFANKEFNARRNALWRRYRYTVRTARSPSVFMAPFTWHCYTKPLDVPAMNAAAQVLKSAVPLDLSAFRKANAPASHTMITVSDISVRTADNNANLVELEVTADWFVYGMMRLLAATLIQVGTGSIALSEFREIVDNGLRQKVKFSAPPNGLCLLCVGYPDEINPFTLSGDIKVAREIMTGGIMSAT